MQNIKVFGLFLGVLLFAACNSKPKVIEAESGEDQQNAPIFQDPGATAEASDANVHVHQDMNAAGHKVVALEALNTEKYTYLRVKEDGEEKWLAVMRQDVKIGGNYVYRGGLMKKNFQSKEFNRVFETVYLVSEFMPDGGGAAVASQGGIPPVTEALEPPKNITRAPGAIKISQLVANLPKYEGKTVMVTGKCVKVNPMIMGRNWLHIQDGSGKNLDLTVTTTENVPLGAIVTLEGVIALKKDFGAGYKYDYIMEGAVLK